MAYHDTSFNGSNLILEGILSSTSARKSLRRTYGRAAAAAAIENGLMPEELGEVLGGRRVVEVFPVGGGESVGEYAHRAVAEMMVAYLRHGLA